MSSKANILVAIGFVVAAGVALFTYHHMNSKPVAQTAAITPVVFQPEAAMLTQAVSTTAVLDHSVTLPPVNLHPSSSDVLYPTSTPYVYNPSLCPASATNSFLCQASLYKQLTANYGVDIAISDIEQRYNQNSETFSDCHPLMHLIGQEASLIYPEVSTAYLHGSNFCWSGYYHGILEGVVGRIGETKLPSELNTICADIPGKATYDFNYYNCVHGLGHGIMELQDDNVSSSLSMCDNLTGNWEEESCYSGVFMENIISYDHDGTSTFLKSDDLLYPCDSIADKYKSECYLGQTSYALQQDGYNFKDVFNLCSGVAEPYRDICDQSAGRDAANQAGHIAAPTKATCSLATTPSDVTNCVIGAAKEIVSFYNADSQAKNFCSILDGSDQNVCMTTTEDYYKAL